MRRRDWNLAAASVALGFMILAAGCEAETTTPVTTPKAKTTAPVVTPKAKTAPISEKAPAKVQVKAAEGAKAFLDQTKQIPPRLEWNRNVISRRGGPLKFRVTSQGPFAVTLVTDQAYQAIRNNGQVDKAGILLTVDSGGPTLEKTMTIPAGTTWFIIENQMDRPAEFRLQCFEP